MLLHGRRAMARCAMAKPRQLIGVRSWRPDQVCHDGGPDEGECMVGKASKNQTTLDALIPRADLFEGSDSVVADTRAIRISDLKPGVIYDMLRKPDFQRETNNWTPQQIMQLIKTFANADIIPSVILWQSGSRIFIIDGAHRLSALAAWVHDDYGAGTISREFYKGRMPDHQIKLHDETRALVNKEVGSWAEKESQRSPLNLKDIHVQWIPNTDPKQAADSFIRINSGGTVIDPLEARILREKRSALAIAARVIARGGSGHEYWRHFSDTTAKSEAPRLGREIYSLLFTPELESPVKTMDIPLAGFGYGPSSLRLSFDLVALANNLDVPDSTRKGDDNDRDAPNDDTGTETIEYLSKTKRAVSLMLSNESKSLGLHPALYFYNAGGIFQPAALHNAMAWVLSLEKTKRIKQFLSVRGPFEQLAIKHPVLVKPPTHTYGTGSRTRSSSVTLFDRMLELLTESPVVDAAWDAISKEFPKLAAADTEQKQKASIGVAGGKFSKSVKSAVSFAELTSIPTCELCGGLLHKNGKTVDHKKERSLQGMSSSDNARWVHPSCNSNRGTQLPKQKKRMSP